jgi:3-hydroxyisobutyrate dehydrogenase-like beta-hydroxyacid dehydrogenase
MTRAGTGSPEGFAPGSPAIGFIGLGAMGGGMARNLLAAGYELIGYDLRPEAVAACPGAQAAEDVPGLVARADVVMTSLIGPVYVQVADEHLVPHARQGQIFIDCSTTPAPETRRLAAALAAKGAVAIDAPVSGWWTGARDGMLSVFVGGPPDAVERCRPIFEVIGNPERIIYGGPAGCGQVMKVVQQLQNRLPDAARLEAMAFGVNEGLSLDQVLRIMNIDPDGRDGYAQLARRIEAGESDQISLLYAEWPYYLAEAREMGIPMPILQALQSFLADAERVSQDEQRRPTPDFWRELTGREAPRTKGD